MRAPILGTKPLAKLFTALIGVVLLVFGAVFSLVVLTVALVVGLAVWGWFWWQTRELRRQLDEQMRENAAPTSSPSQGQIIEGEAVVVEEEVTPLTSNRLPESPDRHLPD